MRILSLPNTTVVARGILPPADALLSRIPVEPGVHLLLSAADPPITIDELEDVLRNRLTADISAVRLVLSYATRDELAQHLADRLNITVFAAAGPVLLLDSGMLFVSGAQWLAVHPGGRVIKRGARYPAPPWQESVGILPAPTGGLAHTEVPAGLWLHPAGAVGAKLPASVLTVPVDSGRPTVLVGHPGSSALSQEDLATLESLPRVLLIPFGPDSMHVHDLGERLAAQAGTEVEVWSGVPDTDDGGRFTLTVTDGDGRRTWQPYGESFIYRGDAVPELIRGRPLLSDVPMRSGWQELADGWGVETVRAGWLLRREAGDPEAERARRMTSRSAHPLLVLGAAARREREREQERGSASDAVTRAIEALHASVRTLLRIEEVTVNSGSTEDATVPLIRTAEPSIRISGKDVVAARRSVEPVPLPTVRLRSVSRLRQLVPEAELPAPIAVRAWSPEMLIEALGEAHTRYRQWAATLLRLRPELSPDEPAAVFDEFTALAAYTDMDPAGLDPIVTAAAERGLQRLPSRAGGFLASWQARDWRAGGIYAAPTILVAGQPDGDGVPIAIWTTAARPSPASPGEVLIPPRTRFVVLESAAGAVLLHEAGDDGVSEHGREAARRAVAAWRRAPEPVNPGRSAPATR